MDEFVGQEHILGPGRLLRRAVEADRIQSIILYGPPGTGKTSLARVIANTTRSEFTQVNAVTSGIKELREVIEAARQTLGMHHKRTILFIDEIHRFNKAQQDGLLPAVEDGTVVLIGATTENPYFEVNGALVSRSMIFQLKALEPEDILRILDRPCGTRKRAGEPGPAHRGPGAGISGLLRRGRCPEGPQRPGAGGPDHSSRSGWGVGAEPAGAGGLSPEAAPDLRQGGDYHYDVVSAFIKSIRGSDPDGALHYMARMLASGEQPEFIARRMLIAAAEDIGNAEPLGLVVANAAFEAVHKVGMPEARIILAQACTFLAGAPKSNAAYMAIDEALEDVRQKDIGGVPVHLKDASYPGAKKLGHGSGYLYPHSYPGHWVPQQYLPEALAGARYYRPTEEGKEAEIKARLEKRG